MAKKDKPKRSSTFILKVPDYSTKYLYFASRRTLYRAKKGELLKAKSIKKDAQKRREAREHNKKVREKVMMIPEEAYFPDHIYAVTSKGELRDYGPRRANFTTTNNPKTSKFISFEKAMKFHKSRSEKARELDERLPHQKTIDKPREAWRDRPNRYDVKRIDTVKKPLYWVSYKIPKTRINKILADPENSIVKKSFKNKVSGAIVSITYFTRRRPIAYNVEVFTSDGESVVLRRSKTMAKALDMANEWMIANVDIKGD